MIDTVQYARGQIYWREYNSTPTPGVIAKKRPVLIVSNNVGNAASGVVIVAPLTSAPRKSDLPTQVEIYLNGTKSWIMTEQLICMNQKSLSDYIATIMDYKMREVDEAIKVSLGLSPISGYSSSEIKESPTYDDTIKNKTEVSSINTNAVVSDSDNNSESESEDTNSSDNCEREQAVNKSDGIDSKKRRKNYTNDEKLSFCVDYEDAKVNKSNREALLEKYGINSFGVASNYYKRFKNSLGV